jgi:hypothetical protein
MKAASVIETPRSVMFFSTITGTASKEMHCAYLSKRQI